MSEVAKRDANGKLLPGSTGNRAGRPKGFVGLAKMIRKATGDGAELVQFALDTFRDPNQTHNNRVKAHEWLSDRGFGRPIVAVELQTSIAGDVLGGGDAFAQIRLGDIAGIDLDALDAALGRVLDVASIEVPNSEEADSDEQDEPGEAPALPVPPALDGEDVSEIAQMWIKERARVTAPIREFAFVGSSNVLHIEYDTAAFAAVVTFANGSRYRYRNFTSKMYDDFTTALSPGAWFQRVISKHAGAYPCEKVRASAGGAGPDA